MGRQVLAADPDERIVTDGVAGEGAQAARRASWAVEVAPFGAVVDE